MLRLNRLLSSVRRGKKPSPGRVQCTSVSASEKDGEPITKSNENSQIQSEAGGHDYFRMLMHNFHPERSAAEGISETVSAKTLRTCPPTEIRPQLMTSVSWNVLDGSPAKEGESCPSLMDTYAQVDPSKHKVNSMENLSRDLSANPLLDHGAEVLELNTQHKLPISALEVTENAPKITEVTEYFEFIETKNDLLQHQNCETDLTNLLSEKEGKTSDKSVTRYNKENLSSEDGNLDDSQCAKIMTDSDHHLSGQKVDAINSNIVASEPAANDVGSLDEITPSLPSSFNLAAYINRSETLQQLVKLGVDLSRLENKRNIASFILKLNFESDMKPYIQFLNDKGVTAELLGRFLTINPYIFEADLENLQIRINYLESKKFTPEMISRIISRAPTVLNLSTVRVDQCLGFLQKEFSLTGDELRDVVSRSPKLIIWKRESFLEMQFALKEEFGFSDEEVKTLFMAKPKIWLSNREMMTERFDLLHNTIGISHEAIVKYPGVLMSRSFRTKQRHLFLKSIGRAQYDPTKENYVSLKALISGKDSDFCHNVAKDSLAKFNEFLKTM